MKKELIKSIQDVDTLKLAEDITGRSYKDNEETGLLGMAIQINKSKIMENLMDLTDDTKFSETTKEYLRKVGDFGIEVVYEEDFKSGHANEKFYVLWHKTYSILLCFDTYRGNRNGGNYYYNWSPNDLSKSDLTSSGGWRSLYMDFETMTEKPNPEKEPRWNKEKWEDFLVISKAWSERNKQYVAQNNLRRIWSGHHDCREGLKNQINLMAENGTFLTKWIDQPLLWLSHHGDNKNHDREYEYKPTMDARYEKLPQFVRDCINKK